MPLPFEPRAEKAALATALSVFRARGAQNRAAEAVYVALTPHAAQSERELVLTLGIPPCLRRKLFIPGCLKHCRRDADASRMSKGVPWPGGHRAVVKEGNGMNTSPVGEKREGQGRKPASSRWRSVCRR
jgi:hypothetical protein